MVPPPIKTLNDIRQLRKQKKEGRETSCPKIEFTKETSGRELKQEEDNILIKQKLLTHRRQFKTYALK